MRSWKLLFIGIFAGIWPGTGISGETGLPLISIPWSTRSCVPISIDGEWCSDGLKGVLARAAKDEAKAQFLAAMYYHNGEQANPELAVRYMKQAVEAGYAEAIGMFGCWFIKGEVVPRDEKNGERLLRRAAEMGEARAQNNLGSVLAERGQQKEALEWFRKAAEKGYPGAELNMALAYSRGFGVEKDEAEETRWLERAGNQGIPIAMQQLAEYYTKGYGAVAKDDAKAVDWTRKAAAAGVVFSQVSLGIRYWRGDGVRMDPQEAVRWFLIAAENGNAIAQDYLAQAYQGGFGVEKNLAQAAHWYSKAAEMGDTHALLMLGLMHYLGKGVTKDVAAGLELLQKASELGNHRADACLGEIYTRGMDVPCDIEKGLVYLRKAAEAGEALAQFYLSGAYCRGDGVKKDLDLAMEWARRSAQLGCPPGQRQYALFLVESSFEPKVRAEAAEWMRKAAENGDPVAQFQYAMWCVEGECELEADPVEGVRWMRFSALQGFAQAEAFYGHSLDSATGCERDFIEAYKWYTLAIRHTQDPDLKRATGVNLQALILRLTPEQVEEGKKRVERFVPVREKKNDDDPFAIGA